MEKSLLSIFNISKKYDIEQDLFNLSIIFLPTALPLSGIFLIFALIISYKKNFNEFLSDRISHLLILTSTLMLISCFFITSNFTKELLPIEYSFDKSLVWIDLLNWIPLFFIFIGAQKYTYSEVGRKLFAKCLIIGSIPVIISCMLQEWLKIYGPFEFLFGSIIWFQREPIEGNYIFLKGITGLFSNQNYLACWLSTIWPFSIYFVIKNKDDIAKKFTSMTISLLTLFFTILTTSRNALVSIMLSLLLIYEYKRLLFFSFLFLIISIFLIIVSPLNFFDLSNNLFSFPLIIKIFSFNIQEISTYTRVTLWNTTFDLISKNPIIGYGAGSFIEVLKRFQPNNFDSLHHAHNIFLQLAYNYGVLVSACLIILISLITVKSFIKLFDRKKFSSIIDKCWIISFLIILVFNLTDIVNYDGKFSILFWLLLTGLRGINQNSLNKNL